MIAHHPPTETAQVVGVACLLLALELAAPDAVVLRPLARLSDDYVAATVMVDVGGGALPFNLQDVRLACDCLRADPPHAAAGDLAVRLAQAADTAEAAALRLLGAMN